MKATTLPLNLPISIRLRPILNLKLFWILVFFAMILLLVLYIFLVNILTSQIYLIKDYQKRVEELSKENKTLEISLSKMNSLSNIGDYLLKEDFVKANPNQIKYIQILETIVTK